jgi:hypothetical protein
MYRNQTQGAAKADLPPIPAMEKVTKAQKAAQAPAQASTPAPPGAVVITPSSIPGGDPSVSVDPSKMIPPQAVEMTEAFFAMVIVIVIGLPIVRAWTRRFDKKTQAMQVTGPDLTPQLRQLQDTVDSMAIEIERISEGQRFTNKLMSERAERVAIEGPR